MSMMDAVTERSRPIMQYVRELEGKVRYYQRGERRFRMWWFGMGCLCGWILMAAAFGVVRLMFR